MPLNAPSPLSAFQMGQARGRANSPVTGIGLAIQNIVDDARKKGLLQSQSQFQTEGAKDLFKFKQENTPARKVFSFGDTGEGGTPGLTEVGEVGEKDVVRNAPGSDDSDPFGLKAIANLIDSEGGIDSLFDTGGKGNKEEDAAALKLLKDNNLDATPGNIEEAKRQLKGR
jgi:hypothetical protein